MAVSPCPGPSPTVLQLVGHTIFTVTLSFSQAIENIDTLTNLESLFLGKNKITKLQNLDALTNLTVLSMQVLTRLHAPAAEPRLGHNCPAPRTLVFCRVRNQRSLHHRGATEMLAFRDSTSIHIKGHSLGGF